MSYAENPGAMLKVDLTPIITSDLFVESQESLFVHRDIGSFFDAVGDLSSGLIRTNRQNLFPHVDVKKADAILDNQDFSGASPLDSEYQDLLNIEQAKERISRELIRRVVNSENNLGLSSTEKLVLLAGCDIADSFDTFYFDWRQDLLLSPLARKVSNFDRTDAINFLISNGAEIKDSGNYQYVVFRESANGEIETLSYADAYPEPILEIGNRIDILIDDLSKQPPTDEKEVRETESLIIYFNALKKALSSSDPAEHEKLYRELDEAWMLVNGRMQPVHMMEAYVDPLGSRVEPEFSISFRDDRYEEVNSYTEQTKSELIKKLKRDFSSKKSLKPSILPMESSLAGVFSFMSSGRRLDFRPAGQNIPNREAVRLKNGVKIFLDMKTFNQRWVAQKELLEKIFGKEFIDRNIEDDDRILQIAAGVFVAGHEVAHNAFVKEGTRANIGPLRYKLIEEHKADMAIQTAFDEFLTPQDKVAFIQYIIGSSLKRLSEIKDTSKKPYQNSAICNLNAMWEVGMLVYYDREDIKFDISPEKIKAFTKKMNLIFKELVEVYETQSPELAEEFMWRYYEPNFVTSRIIDQLTTR